MRWRCLTGPDQTHTQRRGSGEMFDVRRQSCPPVGDAGAIGREVWTGRRDGLEGRAVNEGEAHDRTNEVVRRRDRAGRRDGVDASEAGEERQERCWRPAPGAAAGRGELWEITRELEDVAETALLVDEQRTALQRLAGPA